MCGKAYYSSDQLCHHRKLCEKSRKLKVSVKVFACESQRIRIQKPIECGSSVYTDPDPKHCFLLIY
jgi:hypothetical protein